MIVFLSLATGAASIGPAQPMPDNFVDALAVIPELMVDMRYAGTDNFLGRRVDGYEAPVCLLTRDAAKSLSQVQQRLNALGLGLKLFDCYRPTRAVADFVRWAHNPHDEGRKSAHYPEVPKSELIARGYIADRSSHSRGSTVDATVVDLASGKELDMGTTFDWFGPRSWPGDRSQPPQIRANRLLLRSAMADGGFKPLDQEWWHFTLIDEPYPDRSFDFPVRLPDHWGSAK
jgi:D-alanyl-D-alanine dipeptidase